LLGTRPYEGKSYANLARETFIAPLIWEDGWPVIAPNEGKVLTEFPAPNLPEFKIEQSTIRDDFNNDLLAFQWNLIRTPSEELYSLNQNKGNLRLFLKPETITEKVNPAFIGRRQQHKNFEASTSMEFSPQNKETAGLLVYQNPQYHFKLEYVLKDGKKVIRLTKLKNNIIEILAEQEVNVKKLYLKVSAIGQDYAFYFATKEGEWTLLMDKVNGNMLNRTVAGGFTGVYLAMYASSNGYKTSKHADFDWFDYQEVKPK
jgi:alpha-N-arabinofuranosidase